MDWWMRADLQRKAEACWRKDPAEAMVLMDVLEVWWRGLTVGEVLVHGTRDASGRLCIDTKKTLG